MKIKPLDNCLVMILVDNVTDILSSVPESETTEMQNVFRAGAKELSGASSEKIINRTVEDLGHFGLQQIVPGHCTGWRAIQN